MERENAEVTFCQCVYAAVRNISYSIIIGGTVLMAIKICDPLPIYTFVLMHYIIIHCNNNVLDILCLPTI